jgi:uncharacterized repeat protein (TIGR01451 family)
VSSAFRARRSAAAMLGAVLGIFLVIIGTPARADGTSGEPDLVVQATSDATAPVPRGAQVRYSVTVGNVGTAAAHDVTVTVRLPSRVTPIHLLPAMDGGVCSATGSTEPGSAFTAFCTRRSLPVGTTAIATVDVRIDRDRRCGPMRAVATVAAQDEPPAARDDDTTTRVDEVRCEASIQVDPPEPGFARIGALVHPRFQVTNDGDLTLHGLELAGNRCSIVPVGHLLRPGGRRSVTCSHRVSGSGAGGLRIRVIARSPDGGIVRVAATARFSVIHPAITVSLPTPRIAGVVGSTVSYRVVVRNTGDSLLSDLHVRRSGGHVVGRVISLPPGGTATLTATEPLHAGGSHPNLITVTARDRSGALVTAHALAVVTVSAKRSPTPPITAFTGGWTAAGGIGAAILALLGATALVLGRRRRPDTASNATR